MALAARGGRVDGLEAQQLVASGLTLLQRSAPLVRALSGKRAAIVLPTSPAFVTALAASDGRGAVLVNPLAAPPEVAHQLADARVGAVFTVTELATRLPAGVAVVLLDDAPRTARVIVDGVGRDVDLGSHAGLSIEGNTDAAGRDDEAAIVYTSAMAGVPLGAILTHRNLLTNARSTIVAAGNSSADRVLALLPFSHLFGLTVTASAPLLAGGSVVTVPRFNPGRAVDLIEAQAITEVVGVPAVFRALLAAVERRGKEAVASLRLCICGGSPLSVELQDRWVDATGVELRQGYGLTEAGPVCLFNRVDQPNARGTLGAPFPEVEVDLVGEEICVRGENVFRGYVSRGDDGLLVRDGWLHTGDTGRRDKTGHIVFTGLIKAMFTRNGFNIYPREIERVISGMPGAASVSVREGPADEREPDIVVDVTGDVVKDDVEQWCAERLSAYKQPTVVNIRTTEPRTE
jgi:long-chain acyl-CoA synthetase